MVDAMEITNKGSDEQYQRIYDMTAKICKEIIPVMEAHSHGKNTFILRGDYHLCGHEHVPVVDKLIGMGITLIGVESGEGRIDHRMLELIMTDNEKFPGTPIGGFEFEKYFGSEIILYGLANQVLEKKALDLDSLLSAYEFAGHNLWNRECSKKGGDISDYEGMVFTFSQKKKFIRNFLTDDEVLDEIRRINDPRLDIRNGFDGLKAAFDYDFGKELKKIHNEVVLEERNAMAVQNAYKALAEYGKDMMLIVYGDDHVEGMLKIIRDKGDSYILLKNNEVEHDPASETPFGIALLEGMLALNYQRVGNLG